MSSPRRQQSSPPASAPLVIDSSVLRDVHTEDDGTWLVQVAQADNGFWYAVDQQRIDEVALRYVGPFVSREDALAVAYDRYATALRLGPE